MIQSFISSFTRIDYIRLSLGKIFSITFLRQKKRQLDLGITYGSIKDQEYKKKKGWPSSVDDYYTLMGNNEYYDVKS